MKRIPAIVATTCFVLGSIAINVAAPSPTTSETFTWSGELVSFDANSRVVTVKSRLVNEHEAGTLSQFKPGDRIVLRWSGYDTYSDGISRAVKYDAGQKLSDRFMLPVEFAGFDSTTKYLTFKFEVPTGSVEAVKAVKPGHWITATAKHRPSNETEAIMSVKSYVTTSPHTSSN